MNKDINTSNRELVTKEMVAKLERIQMWLYSAGVDSPEARYELHSEISALLAKVQEASNE